MNPAQTVPWLPSSKSQAYFFLLSFLDSEALPPSLLSQLKDFVYFFPHFFYFSL